MRFLLDESCADGDILHALKMAGHDVQVALTHLRGAEDDVVVAAAVADARIVITKDRDFGQLVFAQGQPTSGVVYVRWPVLLRKRLAPRLVALVDEMGDRLPGAFVALRLDRVRVRRRPAP